MILLLLFLLVRVEAECQLDCTSHNVTDCQVCHTIHVKQCEIGMKKVMVPARVRKCYPVRRSSFDGLECVDGARTRCKVRYETECSKTMEYQVIEEDYPRCRTEKVRSCTGDSEELTNTVNPQCRYVEVRRCKIAQRTVRKARPRHQCRRVPRKQCVKMPCYDKSSEECRETIRLEVREVPEEKCELLPKVVCQEGECRTKLRTECRCEDKQKGAALTVLP